jgi:hypothetical protein
LAVAVMQLAAWYVNAKRYAVGGSGVSWFLGSASWSPPGDWWTWLAAAVLAGACIAALSLADTSRRPVSRPRRPALA